MSKFTLPGYEYCGPGTDLTQAGEPINELDECCRRHDLAYSDTSVSTYGYSDRDWETEVSEYAKSL